MGILSWVLLGFIAGFFAKWLMPGIAKNGLLMTILLGIIGSFAGGFVASILNIGSTQSFSLEGVATAVIGAVIVLFTYSKAISAKG
ncbi:GlsB/YeaQ/YmgE family stress response membrane protein [Bacteriovoracaceae bacterium]|nr:GlsB/YeaQ/YmgE family stress response membrane protein [Bacteriovoracaceae bacterium]